MIFTAPPALLVCAEDGQATIKKGWKGPSDPQAAQSARDKPKATAGGKIARTESGPRRRTKEARKEDRAARKRAVHRLFAQSARPRRRIRAPVQPQPDVALARPAVTVRHGRALLRRADRGRHPGTTFSAAAAASARRVATRASLPAAPLPDRSSTAFRAGSPHDGTFHHCPRPQSFLVSSTPSIIIRIHPKPPLRH